MERLDVIPHLSDTMGESKIVGGEETKEELFEKCDLTLDVCVCVGSEHRQYFSQHHHPCLFRWSHASHP